MAHILFRRRRAFTLVEFLVVVAMIGLIVAVTIPAWLKAQHKYAVADIHGHARSIWQAIVKLDAERFREDGGTAWPTNARISTTQYFKECFPSNLPDVAFSYTWLAASSASALTSTNYATCDPTNNAWCLTIVNQDDLTNNVPFLFTQNFVAGNDQISIENINALDPEAKPFGSKAGVVVTLHGSAFVLKKLYEEETIQDLFNPLAATNSFIRPEAWPKSVFEPKMKIVKGEDAKGGKKGDEKTEAKRKKKTGDDEGDDDEEDVEKE